MLFSYKGLQNDAPVKGTIETENEGKVVEYLKSKNITIVSVERKGTGINFGSDALFAHVTFNDVVNLTRQLSIMLSAGLSIVDSLDILKKQVGNKAVVKLVSEIDDDVRSGMSFSSALKRHGNTFGTLYIALVKAGEASGKLDAILLKLADGLERQRTFRGKVKGALIYPAVIVVAMVMLMFIMMTFVVPQLLELYKNFNTTLPLPTLILIAISGFFQSFWWLMIIIVTGGILALRNYFRTKKGRESADAITLRLPIIKNIIKISALVNSTQTLAILTQSGVSILDSLDIVIESTNNVIYQESFRRIRQKVEKGETLGKSLESEGIYPPILVQMTAVGEQTGHLDETLMHLANYFENESEMAIKALTTLIEPAILVVLGVAVGFLVIAVIMPIFSLSSAL